MTTTMTDTMNVDKKVIDALLKIARIGYRQSVIFSRDNGVMAKDAAILSKDMCGRSIEILLAVLIDQEPEIEKLTEGLDGCIDRN